MLKRQYICPPLSGAACFTFADIQHLLTLPGYCNRHEGHFIGKNDTSVHTDGRILLKLLPPDTVMTAFDSPREWLKDRRLSDIRLAVAPPEKTWVLVMHEGSQRVGNLTFIGRPMHQTGLFTTDEWRAAMVSVIEMIVAAGARQAALDPGLSNFILARDGRIYYVDDDVYPWDGFRLFAQSLATLLRQRNGVDATWLGQLVAVNMTRYFRCDRSLVIELGEAVQDSYIPDDRTTAFTLFAAAYRNYCP